MPSTTSANPHDVDHLRHDSRVATRTGNYASKSFCIGAGNLDVDASVSDQLTQPSRASAFDRLRSLRRHVGEQFVGDLAGLALRPTADDSTVDPDRRSRVSVAIEHRATERGEVAEVPAPAASNPSSSDRARAGSDPWLARRHPSVSSGSTHPTPSVPSRSTSIASIAARRSLRLLPAVQPAHHCRSAVSQDRTGRGSRRAEFGSRRLDVFARDRTSQPQSVDRPWVLGVGPRTASAGHERSLRRSRGSAATECARPARRVCACPALRLQLLGQRRHRLAPTVERLPCPSTSVRPACRPCAVATQAAPSVGDAALFDHLGEPLPLRRRHMRSVHAACAQPSHLWCEHPQRSSHRVVSHDRAIVVQRLRDRLDRGCFMRAIADRYTVDGSVECRATTESAIVGDVVGPGTGASRCRIAKRARRCASVNLGRAVIAGLSHYRVARRGPAWHTTIHACRNHLDCRSTHVDARPHMRASWPPIRGAVWFSGPVFGRSFGRVSSKGRGDDNMKLTGAQALIKSPRDGGRRGDLRPARAAASCRSTTRSSTRRSATSSCATSRAPATWPRATPTPPAVPASPWSPAVRRPPTSSRRCATPTWTRSRWSCITGQVPTTAIGTDAFQECDTVGITRSGHQAQRAGDVGRRTSRMAIREAFHIATTGRPGPVLVDIPKDIVSQNPIAWTGTGRPTPRSSTACPATSPNTKGHPRMIKEAAELILAAERPILYAGGGILKARAAEALRELAELTDIHVVTTLMARGAFPDDHPLCLGMPGMHGNAHRVTAMQKSRPADRARRPLRRPRHRQGRRRSRPMPRSSTSTSTRPSRARSAGPTCRSSATAAW